MARDRETENSLTCERIGRPGLFRDAQVHSQIVDRRLRRPSCPFEAPRSGSPAAPLTADHFIEACIDTAFWLDTTIFGIFIDGEVRASAELRSIFGGGTPDDAEAAFAVEADWQD